jgi:hypothetical protein
MFSSIHRDVAQEPAVDPFEDLVEAVARDRDGKWIGRNAVHCERRGSNGGSPRFDRGFGRCGRLG